MSRTRVAVTTTPGRAADKVSGLLIERALEPVLLPCIEVVPSPADVLAGLRAAAEGADWIVLTSRRAVEIVWEHAQMPTRPAVAVVGDATAEAVTGAGGRVVVKGNGGARRLHELLDGRIEGANVVFPHARAADPVTAAWLGERAEEVEAAPAYDTVPMSPGGDPVDAAVFGSPSAVAGWRRTRSLDGLDLAAMGETTAAVLEAAGHPAHVIPERPGYESLVDDLAEYLTIGHRS